MLSLPDELILKIVGNLCLHCTTAPDALETAKFDSPSSNANHHTLANLCLVCHRLRDICQPILHHIYNARDKDVSYFIRTCIERDELASAVHVLSLGAVSRHCGAFATRKELFVEACLKLHSTPPIYRVEHEEALMYLLALCRKNINYLLLAPSTDKVNDSYGDKKWNIVGHLPELTTLVLVTDGGVYHLFQRRYLLAMAPKLAVLNAADCSCPMVMFVHMDYKDYAFRGNLYLPSLRRLSLNGLDEDLLEKLLEACPQLEDLELHFEAVVPPPWVFASRRGQLRRFVMTISPWEYPRPERPFTGEENYPDDIEVDDIYECTTTNRHFELVGDDYYDCGISFHEFCSLEILEVNQSILFGHTLRKGRVSPADHLTKALPSSIRILHIGFILSWDLLFPCLLEMAYAKKAGQLPSLVLVQIDPIVDPGMNIPEDDREQVELCLAIAGIEFIVGVNHYGQGLRGMLPQRVDGSYPHKIKGVNYLLQ